MIKFEEHEGKLFRMLEEPVPLTDDTKLPVLVQLIQDDTMLGKANKISCHPDTLVKKRICSYLTDGGLFLDGNYTYRYEIIGYPVAEGSAEWALYQIMHGRKVCCSNVAYKALSMGSTTNIGAYYIGHPRHGGYYCTVDTFLLETVKTGWQIYEPKPLLADTGIGDIVKTNLGDWLQIVDTPCLRFGHDECHRTHDGVYWGECGVCDTDSTYRLVAVEPLATEGTKEWALQMMKLGKCVCHVKAPSIKYHKPTHYVKRVVRENCTDDMYDAVWMEGADPTGWQLYEPKLTFKVGDWVECFDKQGQRKLVDYFGGMGCYKTNYDEVISPGEILRKIPPSEIIVKIGCLSGTVRPVSTNGIHIWFHLTGIDDRPIAIIRISCLDIRTRELVEDLLKAQDEEK